MEQVNTDHKKAEIPGYTKPEIRDYGELRELTAAHAAGHITDVPKGSSAPNVFC